jgi:hypothetical protein
VELDAIAHGDHDLSTYVGVVEVMAGQLAGKVVDGSCGVRRERDGVAAAVGIEREAEGVFGVGEGVLAGGDGLELSGNIALALEVELAVEDVDAQRCVRLDRVSVLAGESFDLADCGFGSLRRVRRRAGQRREEKQGKTESGWSETETEQAKGPP